MLTKYKENYLLKGAGVGFGTFLLIEVILLNSKGYLVNPTRLDGFTNFRNFVLSAIILAPILEEIAFRGFFTKHKILKIVSLIGLSLFVFSVSKLYLIILIPYLCLSVLVYSEKINIDRRILYFISALLFALVHYKVKHFSNIYAISPIISQFSFGLLFVWLTINFNIIVSIGVHFLTNLSIIILLFLPLQNPDQEEYTQVIDGYEIKWERTAVLNNPMMVSKPSKYEVKAKNVTPIELYKFYGTVNGQIKDYELFAKYNINIKSIDSTQQALDSTIVKNLLSSTKLITELEKL